MKWSNGFTLLEFTGLAMSPIILKHLPWQMVEGLTEDSVTVPARLWHLAGLGKCPPIVVYAWNRHHGSPIPWESQNQRIKMKVTSLTVNPSDARVKFLFCIPAALASAGLEVLVAKGEMLSPGDTAKIALNQNLKLPSGLFWPWINRQSTYWGDWSWLSRGNWVATTQWG